MNLYIKSYPFKGIEMRTDLCISYDDNNETHYINFDRIIGDGLGVETGGYIGVRQDEDGNVYIVCVGTNGDVIHELAVPVSSLIGGE
jgi:hypothetical protein